ncbi:hypothetical protein [Cupriavidus pauculus]|uniref:hypothetical protein n=2 Tax=Cupriavidus pauculus TaxID=82633 RepID=UPI000781C6A9|nr:hypothetical protein [Cupriavidus pauculus]KAB0602196.1 hypothetical protein F7R19_13985 [Cupriavidus pauculus]MBY4732986.1 hypothetical protein [Cupriavidus pauculus]
MKRILATTALALSTMICAPVMAQQAPVSPNAPNPSAPPAPEGPSTARGNSMSGSSMSGSSSSMSSDSTMHKDTTTKHKNTGARAKKPREQNAPAYSTPDAPSGPKGDSPDPAPKQ